MKERKNDLHETPPEAVVALLQEEKVPQVIWEPCCGPGAIVRVLRAFDRTVVASDLVDYDHKDQDHAGWDFLMESVRPVIGGEGPELGQPMQAIVMNPPFKLAREFVRHALALMVPKVYVLARLALLESEVRTPILERDEFARVLVFRNRLPMMHRDGYDGPKLPKSTVAHAWFVWDRDHTGPATIRRISWRET